MNDFNSYYIGTQLANINRNQQSMFTQQEDIERERAENERKQQRNNQIMQLRIEIAVSKDKGEPTGGKEELLNSLLEDIEREKIWGEIVSCCYPSFEDYLKKSRKEQEDELNKLKKLQAKAQTYIKERCIDVNKISIEELRQYLDFLHQAKAEIKEEEEEEYKAKKEAERIAAEKDGKIFVLTNIIIFSLILVSTIIYAIVTYYLK